MLIVGAIELGDGNIPGRLRLAEISSYGAADLGHFVETAADPDAIAKTDGWSGYAAVPADRHNVHVVGKTAAHLVLPWIHQVFSNLKGWARGVYHGLNISGSNTAQSYFETAGLRDLQRRRILGILTPHQEGVVHSLPGLEQHQSGRRAVSSSSSAAAKLWSSRAVRQRADEPHQPRRETVSFGLRKEDCCSLSRRP